MNRFDRERIGGFREGALAVYNAMKDRPDVPVEVKEFALELIRRAGDVNCEGILESLGVPRTVSSGPAGPTRGAHASSGLPR